MTVAEVKEKINCLCEQEESNLRVENHRYKDSLKCKTRMKMQYDVV